MCVTLKLKAGDQIAFEITNDKQAVIKKAMLIDIAYLHAVEFRLIEWNLEIDKEV
jgi:hypothetical protein